MLVIQIFISLIAFIITLTFLVGVHELGHLLVAKWMGVKVLRFSIGFGRPIFRWFDKSGTEYVIAIIPLGGYVKMLGEQQDEKLAEDEAQYSFTKKPVIRRMAIIFAGPLFNFIFAVFALWLMFVIGVQGIVPIIGKVQPGSLAAKAGLEIDYKIVNVNGHRTSTWWEARNRILVRIGDKKPILINAQNITSGIKTTHYLRLKDYHPAPTITDLLGNIGIYPKLPPIPPIIASVNPKSAAFQAGIRPGDKIVKVESQKIDDLNEAVKIFDGNINKKIQLVLLRDGKFVTTYVVPQLIISGSGQRSGRIGIRTKEIDWPKGWMHKEKYSLISAFVPAVTRISYFSKTSLKLLYKIVSGRISWRYIGGPISIAHGAGVSISFGLVYFLEFLALVSVSLGIVNLLPIPVLDGGYLLYYVLEIITGKPLSRRVQILGIRIGMLVLLSLMALAIFNDLMRL